MNTVSIGLKARTGKAIVVVLAGPAVSPRVVTRTELVVTDPTIPATSQPYHEVMDLPWNEATEAVKIFKEAIEKIAAATLSGVVRDLKAAGLKVSAVGIAGSADRVLEKIGNPHIRAHAAEGILFRQVLELATKANRLRHRTFAEKDLEELAALELGLTIAQLKQYLSEIGRSAGPPWRTEQRIAATAAWLTLPST
jgi:hypothetical protein